MKVRILVADDSTEWSTPFCEFLARMGFKAESVATGSELEQLIKASPQDFDILIVDNSMPERTDEPELPYCGVHTLGVLVSHFSSQNLSPPILNRVIVRSIYSRSDLEVLREREDPDTERGCAQVAEWFDRSSTLDDLMGAIERLSSDIQRLK
jgi:hypothetical protein